MTPSILPLLFGLLLLTLPIFAALAATALIALWVFTDVPTVIVAQRMFAGIDNFTLMSIPFFILAADLMRFGGLSERLIHLARTLVGWMPGGLAVAGVLACTFFAAISGSSPATVAAIGSIMIPALIAAGYAPKFSVGLLTTAGSLGILIPPSITFIIYGAVTGTSIGELFVAGVLPGLIISLMLMTYCVVHAARTGVRRDAPPTGRQVWDALRGAGWGLGMPILIIGGIYGGIFTPTEAAAVAAMYGFFVGAVVYRQLGWREVTSILKSTGLLSASLLLITAGASAFSWLLASQGIPTQLAQSVLSLSSNPWVVLLLFNLVLLVAGCFLDGASAVIILAPLMLPIVRNLGVDPVHFGVISVLNMEIGMMTPPVGLNLFVACTIAKRPLLWVAGAAVPTVLIMLVGLVLVTYIPWISLALPQMFYGK